MEVDRQAREASQTDAWSDGETEAVGDFAAFVGPHLAVLTAIAVREVGAVHAEDLVQESVARAWQKWSTFDPGRGSARSWLIAVLLDRARRFRIRSAGQPSALVGEQPSASRDVDMRLVVESAVRGLPRRQRQVITLFYLADLSVEDSARAMGISPSAVRAHLHAARVSLRSSLGDPHD